MNRTSVAAHLFFYVASAGGLSACGSGGYNSDSGSGGGSAAVTGSMSQLLLPSTEAPQSFSPMQASFFSYEVLAGKGGVLAPLASPLTLTVGSSSCAAAGCSYQGGQVPLHSATLGVFVQLAGTAATQSAYVPTATLVVNANQLQTNARSGGDVKAQGLAYAVSTAGLAQVAKLTGLASDVLLARGVALGFVATNRTFSSGAVPAQSTAMISLTNPPAGASVYYPDDDWNTVTTQGTNARGAFIVVGATTPPADGSGTAIGVTVSATGSALKYLDQSVIVRPGLVTAVPILPYP